MQNKIIRTISSEKNGDIWIGTDDGMLVKLNTKTKSVESYKIDTKNEGSGVISILFTKQGEIWIGGNGVFIFNPDSNTFIEQKYNGSSIIAVLDMAEDSSGNIWIASYTDGLFRTSKDKIVTKFEVDGSAGNNLPKDKFVTVFKDSKNRIWAGSEFFGLFLFLPDENRFQHYTVKDGLPSNDICSIQEDTNGGLWIGTNNGLSNFNYSKIDFKNYFWSDGMNADEFHYNSNFADSGDLQYFGCTNGIVIFDPEEIRDNQITYPVKIEDISINNGSVLNDVTGTSNSGSTKI